MKRGSSGKLNDVTTIRKIRIVQVGDLREVMQKMHNALTHEFFLPAQLVQKAYTMNLLSLGETK